MRRSTTTALIGLFALAFSAAFCQAAPPKKIQALLITGDDVGVHDWHDMAASTREVLVDSGRFDVKVCEDPRILDSKAALDDYDVIVFTIYTRANPTISDQAKENLLSFVEGGKGFFVQHLASASFKGWEEFGKLCGRHWVMGKSGHGPRSVFDAKIANAEHPITKGMKDFKADDELYAKLQGSGEINVLVEADSDWSGGTEPLVFTLPYGKGRVVHNAFGHDRKILTDPNVARIIARGTEWAATGEVAE